MTADVVRLGALVRSFQAAHDDFGDVVNQLHVLPTAVADVIRPIERQRLYCLGRLTGHAEVTADAIDRPGTQADRGYAEILVINARVAFIADLEVTIVRRRLELDLIGEPAARVIGGRAKDGCAARV